MKDRSHSPVHHDECLCTFLFPFLRWENGGWGGGCKPKVRKLGALGVLAPNLPALSGAQHLSPANEDLSGF